MTTSLEQKARRSWHAWAVYRKQTSCTSCGERCYCGAARRRGPWLCVGCFDQTGGRRV